MTYPADLFQWEILLIFNIPVLAILLALPFLKALKVIVSEKDATGVATGAPSYSRITGLVGGVLVTSLFWAIGNIVLMEIFTKISDVSTIIKAVWPFFLLGSALFLPYAFNQLKSIGSTGAAAAANVKADPAPPVPAGAVAPLSLAIANLSSVDDATFAKVVAAIQQQVTADFQPEWGVGATLAISKPNFAAGQDWIDQATDAVIYVGDSSSDPTTGVGQVLGYHYANHGQTPYGFVYLDVCLQAKEAWCTTLSHEVLELLADPTASMTVSGPGPAGADAAGTQVNYNLEVCDPVQGDTYPIAGMPVSNFVTKSYFGMIGQTPATNHLNAPLPAFGVRPNGYLVYTDDGGQHQFDGPSVDAARVQARRMMKGWRRNDRRLARRAEPAKADSVHPGRAA